MMNKEWEPCANYAAGNVVYREGKAYRALQQNAGMTPENSPAYWQYLGIVSDIIPPHNQLDGLQGTSEADYFHLNEDQAAAALNADEPSAANPFITRKNMPELGKTVGAFEPIPMPPGMGIVYGGYFDEAQKLLVVVGDGRMASLDALTRTWTEHAVPAGPWRSVTKMGNSYVAVGANKAMAGTLDAMAEVPMPQGNWRSVSAGDSRVVAVAEGRLASSDDGLSGWSAKDVAPGYGDAVAFSAREGKFYAVGAAGCKSAPGNAPWGNAWNVEPIPAGTWRDIVCAGDYMIALSGIEAHKKWDDETWIPRPMPVGGWEGAAAGAGFILGVGNGIAALAKIPALQYTPAEIPNNVYTCAVYGASAFWALGSAILTALVVDVGAALASSPAPNSDNWFVTHNDIVALESALMSEIARLDEAITWGGTH
jgi:hypothetical protein